MLERGNTERMNKIIMKYMTMWQGTVQPKYNARVRGAGRSSCAVKTRKPLQIVEVKMSCFAVCPQELSKSKQLKV